MKTISVIIPTYNAERTLAKCLESVKNQIKKAHEIIVVDAGSTDNTVKIAQEAGATVHITFPNRSAQRNAGADIADGRYLLIIDADMILSPTVLEECASEMTSDIAALVIPEISIGDNFWAKVKSFERSFYQGVPWMEAARFYRKEHYTTVGGFDPSLIGGEDWDLDERLKKFGRIGRIRSSIDHDEGTIKLSKLGEKKSHYATTLTTYAERHPKRAKKQLRLIPRLFLFAKRPHRVLLHPILAVGLFVMGGVEILASIRKTSSESFSKERPVAQNAQDVSDGGTEQA